MLKAQLILTIDTTTARASQCFAWLCPWKLIGSEKDTFKVSDIPIWREQRLATRGMESAEPRVFVAGDGGVEWIVYRSGPREVAFCGVREDAGMASVALPYSLHIPPKLTSRHRLSCVFCDTSMLFTCIDSTVLTFLTRDGRTYREFQLLKGVDLNLSGNHVVFITDDICIAADLSDFLTCDTQIWRKLIQLI